MIQRRALIDVSLELLTEVLKFPKGISIKDIRWDFDERRRGAVRFLLVDSGDLLPECDKGSAAQVVTATYRRGDTGEAIFDGFTE